LAGRKDVVTSEHAGASTSARELAALPNFKLTELGGDPLTTGQLAGRVVLVEFWATWCPPCRSTLEWLGELRKRPGNNLAIAALAVDSPENQIRSAASSLSPDIHWATPAAPTAQSFGDLTAVPTLFLFDSSGKTARVLYGAPPDLHDQVEQNLTQL